jgi:lipid-binding SYLF domain-containing protein
MKKYFAAAIVLLLATTLSWAASAKEDSVERLQMSADVLKALMAAPDKGVPEEVVDNSKCIVVVPHLVKGGFIVGAKHGRGVASCRTASGWSAPAFVSVGGGSWGLQIGVEGVDLLMFIMNDKGLASSIGKFRSPVKGPLRLAPSADTRLLGPIGN